VGLRESTVSGVSWSAVARGAKQGINLLVTVILMRLLDPEVYGLIAMALVLIGFASVFKKFGLSSALIQQKEVTILQSSSVFWVNLLAGILLTAVIVATAPLAVVFFDARSLLEPVIQSLAFIFLFSAVGIVPRAFLKKKMRFKPLAKAQAFSAGLSGPAGIVMAYGGYGVWSLVAKNLLGTVLEAILLWLYSSWRPRLQFSLAKTRELLLYGANLTGFKIINKFARAGDDLLIGRYMGEGSLGVYSQAYKIMMIPIGKGIGVVSNVLFPALSAIQDDKKRVKKVYLKSVQIISFLVFPTMLGLLSVSDIFVYSLFGQKWGRVIPILQVFCVVGVFQTLVRPTGWIYQSQGRADWMFRWGVVGSGTLVIAIVYGVWMGSIEAVALSYLAANVILLYPGITIPGWLINMSFAEVIKSVSGSFLVASVMAGGVFGLGQFLPEFWSVRAKLCAQVVAGVGFYWGLAHLFKMNAYRELMQIASEQWGVLPYSQ
jgi:O-antigen/teichoic acid export membrane protein